MMEKIWWSGKEWTRKIEEKEMEWQVERKLKDIQIQTWREKLRNSRYAGELRGIIGNEKGIYEKEVIIRSKDSLEILARFRLGCETRENKFWMKEGQERICIIDYAKKKQNTQENEKKGEKTK